MPPEWVEVAGIPLLIASRTPPVVFTTRAGGVSRQPFCSLNLSFFTGDAPGSVEENRRIVSRAIDIPDGWLWANQVHGNQVAVGRGGAGVQADALVTAEPGAPVAVTTADCLPIALAARGAVGAVHAGWRGLVNGVIESAVAALRRVAGNSPVRAWIGPSIGPCHYEVGPDVAAAFRMSHPSAPGLQSRPGGAFTLDLRAAAAWVLHRTGVVNMPYEPPCTFCDPRFFSHRREGPTGRQAVLVWRAENASEKKFFK